MATETGHNATSATCRELLGNTYRRSTNNAEIKKQRQEKWTQRKELQNTKQPNSKQQEILNQHIYCQQGERSRIRISKKLISQEIIPGKNEPARQERRLIAKLFLTTNEKNDKEHHNEMKNNASVQPAPKHTTQ